MHALLRKARNRLPDPDLPPVSVRGRQAAFLGLFAVSALGVFLLVDLTPDVERDLFFSTDDPQLAIGAGLAFLCAYVVYPSFLRSADPGKKPLRGIEGTLATFFERTHGTTTLIVVGLALAAVPGLFRLNTDPELFAYFDGGPTSMEATCGRDSSGSTAEGCIRSRPR